MSTLSPLVNFLFRQLNNHAMLVVTGDHEILHYTDKFKDMWCLSDRSLHSRNELCGLKEAMKKMDRPQFFYERVLRTYQNNAPVSNVEIFKTGKIVKAHYYPFKMSCQQSTIIWLCEADEPVTRDKMECLSSLTMSEKKALYYYLFGYTAKAIAAKLAIEKRTAEDRIQHIKDKFACRTRNEFIDLAREWDLINILLPKQADNIPLNTKKTARGRVKPKPMAKQPTIRH